jgi:hypothetical protein
MTKKLPSISTPPSINTPILRHETRAVEPSLNGNRIRGWRSPDVDEQHRMYLQAKKEETYWSIRMKNRP